MLNTTSIDAVNNSTFSQQFRKPLYESYCFANIPRTIPFLLTGEGQSALPLDVFTGLPTRYKHVVLFFVDAFGWRFFERYLDRYPVLQRFVSEGVVSKLTSQFPSTTAAHVTSVHTGLEVGQSGVYEWHYYEPLVDDIISPLLFSYAKDGFTRDTLKQQAVSAEAFYPHQTLYRQLQAIGVTSRVFQAQDTAYSTFSNTVFQGAAVHAFAKLPEAFEQLTGVITADAASPSYSCLYYGTIDAFGHRDGPSAATFDASVQYFLMELENLLNRLGTGKVGETLFLMTADHGQMEVDPRTTIYLNEVVPTLKPLLQTNRHGVPLVPAGSARDMFLHIKPEHLEEAMHLLQTTLVGRAEVYVTQELINQQFFGSQAPSAEFLSRVGNVVVLPYLHETVWWREGTFSMQFMGHHGGLMPWEMDIPLMALAV